jgi:hypothetical protein
MEFNISTTDNKHFLEEAFLRLPFVAGLLILSLFYLFHEVTFAIAMHPGPGPVFAKLGGNVIPVQFKSRVYKKAREVN